MTHILISSFKESTERLKISRIKVLEYLQKTKTLKMTFLFDQSFGIGLK